MADETKPSITPMPDGPYVVKNLKNFNNVKGAIEPKQASHRWAQRYHCRGRHAWRSIAVTLLQPSRQFLGTVVEESHRPHARCMAMPASTARPGPRRPAGSWLPRTPTVARAAFRLSLLGIL